MNNTIPNVFIIESLKFSDEDAKRYEGKFLSQILNLAGKETKYYYVRTKKELEEVMRIFEKSKFRYLHLSCHGNSSSISTTLESLPFSEFGQIIEPYLEGKRLFISACKVVNGNLASEIFPYSKCISIIGPYQTIYFNDAAIVWASFYHLLFKLNYDAMRVESIMDTIKKIRGTFGVYLNYYAASNNNPRGFRRLTQLPPSND